MRRLTNLAILLAFTSVLLPRPASAQQGMTLKFSWDHCAADGYVGDKFFACDVNTGEDVLFASAVINDGNDRQFFAGFQSFVDFTVTTPSLPSWWLVLTGTCRANAIGVNFGPFPAGGSCAAWYAPSGLAAPVHVLAFQTGIGGQNVMRAQLGSYVPAGSEVTLPAGQELLYFVVRLTHAKSTGTGACAGCDVPTCIGFGDLELAYPSPIPGEKFVGTTASTVTWQGAHVTGYSPVPGHMDSGGFIPYYGNLGCSLAPVPTRGRTWGLIKTMYR